MKKRNLAALPIVECSKTDISESRRTSGCIRWLIRCQSRRVDGRRLLVISLYWKAFVLNGKTAPEFRIFVSNSDYTTQDLGETPYQWKSSTFARMQFERYREEKERYYYFGESYLLGCSHILGDDSMQSLQRFFDKGDASLRDVFALQEKILYKRRLLRYKREMRKIDDRMKDVSALPKDFKQWLRNDVMLRSRYVFYHYRKGKKQTNGYCTHCKHEVMVTEARHGKMGQCPRCRSQIKYRALGRGTNILDYNRAALIQKTPDGIVLRYFRVYYNFRRDYQNPELSYSEYARDFFINGQTKYELYWMAQFKQSGKYRWCVNPDAGSPYRQIPSTAVLYTKNLYQTLHNTDWQGCGINYMANHHPAHVFNVWRYLYRYLTIPQLRYIVRLGMSNLVDHILDYGSLSGCNLQAKNLQSFLKLGDYYAQMMRRINAALDEIKFAQELDWWNIKVSADDLVYAVKVAGNKMIKKLQRFHMKRKINYIKRQSELLKARPKSIEIDWCDYIRFCERLGMDLRNPHVAFPKNLQKAHDRAYKQVQKIGDLKQQRERRISDLIIRQFGAALNWENDKYLIRTPIDHKELLKEGEILGSCVGGYTEQISERDSLILFLRKKGDENNPFFTLQLKQGKIIQARGKASGVLQADPTPEIKKVIEDYTKTLPSRKKVYTKIMGQMDIKDMENAA